MGFFQSAATGLGFGGASATAGKAAQTMMEAASGSMTSAATGAAVGAAAPLVQQGVSALNSLNDESVIIALLSQLKDEEGFSKRLKLKKWQWLNDRISPHQRSDLRKIIVNLKLPERFEAFMHEDQEPSTQTQPNNQQGNQQKGGHSKSGVKKFARVLTDYELIARSEIGHGDYRLDMIETLIRMPTADAVTFVKSMISELSALEKVEKGAKTAGNEVYRFLAALRLGSAYTDTMTTKEVIIALRNAKGTTTLAQTFKEERKKPLFKKGEWKTPALIGAFILGGILIASTLV